MYIHEAIKAAVEKDRSITRPNHDGEYTFKIKVTRQYPDYFKIARTIKGNKDLIIERWKPDYSDLISGEWILTDNDLEEIKFHLKKEWWE